MDGIFSLPQLAQFLPLTWRCCGCGKVDGDPASTRFTDGLCESCLRSLYPRYAEQIIAEMRAAGAVIH